VEAAFKLQQSLLGSVRLRLESLEPRIMLNVRQITGVDSGTVDGVPFSGRSNLVGTAGDGADVFGAGTIGNFTVKGNVPDSLIGAGLDANGAAAFDLARLKAGGFVHGSWIKGVNIKGTLTGGANAFGVWATQFTGKAIADGRTDYPLFQTEL